MNKCDMCGSAIEAGKCSCGTWLEKDAIPDEVKCFKDSLEAFRKMNQMTITGDAPHLGVAYVFFTGDYKDCKIVEHFIYGLKGRPYYEEKD